MSQQAITAQAIVIAEVMLQRDQARLAAAQAEQKIETLTGEKAALEAQVVELTATVERGSKALERAKAKIPTRARSKP